MNIVDHGTWDYYTPDPLPEGMPPAAMFAGRTDGTDWYDHVKRKPFKNNSVVMTVQQMPDGAHIVLAATRDPGALFPVRCRVVEVDWQGDDPQAHFNWLIYDPGTKAFGERWEPPPDPLIAKLLARIEALENRGS